MSVIIAVDNESPVALAERAFARVEVDAGAGAALADRALRSARAAADREGEVAALHALSFAQHELGDPRAIRTIRAAIRVGTRHGISRRTALARRRLALDLAARGAVGPALRELDAACAALDGLERARSEVFRIVVLWYSGRPLDSLEQSDSALETLRRAGDTLWEARLLGNRGGLLAERGDAAAAERELARARDLFASEGATAAVLAHELQLARVAWLRGDLPACMSQLDAADRPELSPANAAELELLRAEALAAAQLWSEARESLARARSQWARHARDDHGGRLEAIRLTLLGGDAAGALALAARTRRSFAAQGRALHAARAGGLELAAAIATGAVSRGAIASGRRAAATLAAAGWSAEARRVQLAVARAAIELGAVRTAKRELAACAALFRRGPVDDRIEAWHVEALVRRAEGDPAGAQRAARRGLQVLEEHRAALGAADLRATASSIGSELAGLGLRIALAGDRPGATLEWAEALRASALRLTPVTPPRNPELRAALTELRQLTAEVTRTEQAGRSSRSLLARQARVETRVRRLSRHAPGETLPSRARPHRTALAAALGDRALVEFAESDRELWALTVTDGRLRRHALGRSAPVLEALEWLRFGLVRLARLPATAPQRESLAAGAVASAAAVEEALLGPVADVIGGRELVVVPTGALHALPWAMLPSLRGRPVSVAPSAAVWWALARRGHGRGRAAGRDGAAGRDWPAERDAPALLVAGPRLRHAGAEVRSIAALHPGALVLGGAAAGVAPTLRALPGARIAHLACHGHVRADSPLFSSLELADGRLSAYELQQLRRVPELIVLSACDLAVSDARPGDELLGFAGALLDMGSSTIVASVVPVPDAAARRVMPAFHRELVAGHAPAVALARAQARLPARDLPLAGFACLGAG